MPSFKIKYFILFILLFITEVLIALYIDDDFIRPYFGDFLVVILLYCLVKSFINLPVFTSAILVLLFSYLVETLQYFNIVHHLGLSHSKLAKTIIGTYFTWVDILAYTLGILFVLLIEKLRMRVKKELQENKTWLFL